jgi:uncharacterized membrane protein YcaP (DUF421 family)
LTRDHHPWRLRLDPDAYVPDVMVDWSGLWEVKQPIAETLIRSTFVYLIVHLLLRLAGRKELSRYSSFNVAVLFLIGVAVRRTMTVDDASLTTATLALATVVVWDVFFSWLGFRSTFAAKFLKGEPRLLVKDGSPRHDELHACHISMEELLARAREAGLADLTRVDRAHLETSGKISFVVTPARGT